MKPNGKNRKLRKRILRDYWPVACRWAAVGTLVIYSVTGTRTINVAFAQEPPAASRVPPPPREESQTDPLRRFDIPPGPLGQILPVFERATGMHSLVTNEAIREIDSPGVVGVFSAEKALAQLLKDTGIAYRFVGPMTVRLDLANVAIHVDVTGTISPITASLPKLSQDRLSTARTIDVVPQQVMQEQNATTLRDSLRNVAGISLAAGEGGAQGDNLTIRGFTARNDLFIDGMRDFGSYYRDPFNTQEVEVLQGPSSVTFGRGSTGGVVNQASKTPGLSGFIGADLTLGSDKTRRLTFDMDQPLRKLGEGAAFRLNLMGNEGGVAGRDIAENRRFGIAPSLSLGLGSPTRWTFSYLHQTADDQPDYGIPWLFNGPAPVNRSNYYGFADGNYLRTYDDIGTARVEHDFNDHITLRDQFRYANYVRDVLITEAQAPSSVQLNTPLSSIQVNRHEIGVNSVETNLDEQLDLMAHFRTGLLRHNFITGVEVGRETSDPTRPTYSNVPTTSLLNPNPYQPLSGTAAITSRVQTSAFSQAVYALDTISIGSKLDLSGGIRWDRFDTDYSQSVAPAAAFHRLDEKPTWRAAVTFKPVPIGSVYFDAGTSFNPSAESLSLSASTANLPPESNRTYEFGTKWNLGKLAVDSSWFRTEKTNAREPDPNNPTLNVLAGNQRVSGVQASVQGHITSRWEILAGYAYLDSRLVSSNYYPRAIGGRLANVPANTFNIWSSYRLPAHWNLGAGGNFVSSRTASSTAPFDPITGLVKEVPGYWVFNAMLSHPLAEHIDLQVNAYNLANRYYYDELHPAHIVLGPGRSVLAALKFHF